jgi:hypothetical protein
MVSLVVLFSSVAADALELLGLLARFGVPKGHLQKAFPS